MNDRERILTSILKCERIDLTVDPKKLTPQQQNEFGRMVERRAKGEPLQYIIGKADFMGTEISVDPRVLIPRPETEILVDLVIKMTQLFPEGYPFTFLDLGTGSGNIAITLFNSVSDCSVTAVDCDEGAIDVVKKNAKAHNIGEKLKILKDDMIKYLDKARHWEIAYDFIISNPPYIPTMKIRELPSDVQQEPKGALDGGEDGMDFYRKIIPKAHHVLEKDGYLFFEIGDGQADDIKSMFDMHSQYGNVQSFKDYAGTERIIAAQKL